MSDIYIQHDAAFANVTAFVILHKGKRVATVAFKWPRDGADRLYAYVHWIGLEMTRGFASGGGYDKQSTAAAAATDKMPRELDAETGTRVDPARVYNDFRRAALKDDGYGWERNLTDAGFTVLQAV